MTPKFTTPCFIRKNTPELRKKLEELGYYKHPSCLVDKTNKQFLFCNRGMFAELLIGYTEEVENAIDCGENEDLFIALSALRADSDYMQFFVFDEEVVLCPRLNQYIPKGSFYLCLVDKFEPIIPNVHYHKAASTELIEHFKG